MTQRHAEPASFRYVFGPVLSRRLGRSLGIDLVPFKTCTYDCVYCQLGSTTAQTMKRREYVPVEDVLAEVKRTLATGKRADYITLAGSGEPTLHSGIGRFIEGVKGFSNTPVAVITNGSLLWEPAVRHDLLAADLVIPSLDAGTEESFRRVNRPHEAITFEKMVEGLVAFRNEFTSLLWLEILLVDGLTATDREIESLAKLVKRIRPDRAQLTTVTRPSMAGPAKPVPRAMLERFADSFGAVGEVVADYCPIKPEAQATATPDDILNLIRRHPCSMDDIAQGLGIPIDLAMKHIGDLLGKNAVDAELLEGVVMYVPGPES